MQETPGFISISVISFNSFVFFRFRRFWPLLLSGHYYYFFFNYYCDGLRLGLQVILRSQVEAAAVMLHYRNILRDELPEVRAPDNLPRDEDPQVQPGLERRYGISHPETSALEVHCVGHVQLRLKPVVILLIGDLHFINWTLKVFAGTAHSSCEAPGA